MTSGPNNPLQYAHDNDLGPLAPGQYPDTDAPQPEQQSPYVAQDLDALAATHRGQVWRTALEKGRYSGHLKKTPSEVLSEVRLAEYCRAEGQVISKPNNAPNGSNYATQANAAIHLANALVDLDRLARGQKHDDMAREMFLEVASVREPSLSQILDVKPSSTDARKWDYLLEPANLRQLANAAVAQLSNYGEATAWKTIRDEGLTSPRFMRLIEQYVGTSPYGWQQQRDGQGAAVPVSVVSRLSFTIQAEAAMHVRMPAGDRNSILDILDPRLADPNPSKRPTANPAIIDRLNEHKRMVEKHLYGAQPVNHHPQGKPDEFYKEQRDQLERYISSLSEVEDLYWYAALKQQAEQQLQPIRNYFARQAAQQVEAEKTARLAQEQEDERRSRERDLQDQVRLQTALGRRAVQAAEVTRETVEEMGADMAAVRKHTANAAKSAASTAADVTQIRRGLATEAAQREEQERKEADAPPTTVDGKIIIDSEPVNGEQRFDKDSGKWQIYDKASGAWHDAERPRGV